MFTRNKIAAVSGLLCGLALTCVGVAQAHGKGPSNGCKRDDKGNVACVHKSTKVYTSKNGKRIVVKQSTNCSTSDRGREVYPDIELGATETSTTQVGPVVNCSNTAPPPKGFTLTSDLH